MDAAGETAAEWWDDDVASLIECGFFTVSAIGYDGPRVNRPQADASVLDYCEELGLIRPA